MLAYHLQRAQSAAPGSRATPRQQPHEATSGNQQQLVGGEQHSAAECALSAIVIGSCGYKQGGCQARVPILAVYCRRQSPSRACHRTWRSLQGTSGGCLWRTCCHIPAAYSTAAESARSYTFHALWHRYETVIVLRPDLSDEDRYELHRSFMLQSLVLECSSQQACTSEAARLLGL
jgi:hypothetical protein